MEFPRFLFSFSLPLLLNINSNVTDRAQNILAVPNPNEQTERLSNTTFLISTFNTEVNDLRKIICLRKNYVSVGRISVYIVTENYFQ